MKDRILILALLLFSQVIYSQKMPEDYMDAAMEYYYAGDYKKAADNFRYVAENYKDYTEYYPFALYNLAVSYEKLNNTDDAVKLYNEIISKSFDKDIQKQSDLMGNPYANFSFESCTNLGRIYYNKANYEKSLTYYRYADTSHLYKHFCGNAVAEMNYYIKEQIAKCYIRLDEDETAIKILTRELFTDDFASNKKIIRLLIKTLDRNYERDEIKNMLNSSINKIYKRNDYYYMRLFGEEILINDIEKLMLIKKPSKEDILKIIKENKFFKNYLE